MKIINFKFLVSSLVVAALASLLEACAPPATNTTPATTATSSGGSNSNESVATIAAERERLRAAYQQAYDLLQQRNAGQDVDAAVAQLPEPVAPVQTATSTVRSRRHSRRQPTPTVDATPAAPAAPPVAAPAPAAAPPITGSFPSPVGTAQAGPTFRAPITNVIGNVGFTGPTPWEQDGAIVGRSAVSVSLVNMQTAVEIIVNGRRICVSADGVNFTRIATPSGQSVCVVPPMPNIINEVQFLVSDEGSRQVIDIRRYGYNSYTGVGRVVGSCRRTITPSNSLLGGIVTNDLECH